MKKKAECKILIWYLILNKVTVKQHHPQGNQLKARKTNS